MFSASSSLCFNRKRSLDVQPKCVCIYFITDFNGSDLWEKVIHIDNKYGNGRSNNRIIKKIFWIRKKALVITGTGVKYEQWSSWHHSGIYVLALQHLWPAQKVEIIKTDKRKDNRIRSHKIAVVKLFWMRGGYYSHCNNVYDHHKSIPLS